MIIDETVQQTTLIVIPFILVGFVAYYAHCAYYFWKVRGKEPVKTRRPYIVLMQTFVMTVFVCERNLTRQIQINATCGHTIAVDEFLVAVANVFFFARFLLLFFDFAVNQDSKRFLAQHRNENRLKMSKLNVQAFNAILKKIIRPQDQQKIELSKSKSGMLKSELLKENDRVGIDSASDSEKGFPWWFRVKHWMTNSKYLAGLIIFAILAEMLPVSIAINAVPGINQLTRDDPLCQQLLLDNSEAILFVQSLQVVFTVWLFFHMKRTVKENLGITNEISHIALTTLVMFGMEFINLVSKDTLLLFYANVFGINCWEVFALLFPVCYVIYVSLFYPSEMTKTWQAPQPAVIRHSKKEVRDEAEEITACLNNPETFQAFLDFLALEFASYKANFWRDVELYREEMLVFEDIYESYFSELAIFKIQDISIAEILKIEQHHEFRKIALESNQHPPEDSTIYDDVQTEVFRLLFDPFRRFKQTGKYTFIHTDTEPEIPLNAVPQPVQVEIKEETEEHLQK
jgi:hypothetical protein